MTDNSNPQNSEFEAKKEAPIPMDFTKIDEKTDLSSKTPEEINTLMQGKEITVRELTQKDIQESLKLNPVSMHASKLHDYTLQIQNQFDAGEIKEKQYLEGMKMVNDQLKLLNGNVKENEQDEVRKKGQEATLDERADSQAEQVILVLATLLALLKGVLQKAGNYLMGNDKDKPGVDAEKLMEVKEELSSSVDQLEENVGSLAQKQKDRTSDNEYSSPSPNK